MRIAPAQREELDAQGQAVYDEVLASRGAIVGPFLVLLNAPHLAVHVSRLGHQLRFEGTMSDPDRELAIIATAREFEARFEWFVHEALARKVGVSTVAIDAVRTQGPTDALPRRERVLIEVPRAILRRHHLEPALHAEASAELGESMMLELITLVGFYQLIGTVLNAYDVEPPGDVTTF